MIYFFPQIARLTLEEIAPNFGEEVSVHIADATDEEKARLDEKLARSSGAMLEPSESPSSPAVGEKVAAAVPVPEAERNH